MSIKTPNWLSSLLSFINRFSTYALLFFFLLYPLFLLFTPDEILGALKVDTLLGKVYTASLTMIIILAFGKGIEKVQSWYEKRQKKAERRRMFKSLSQNQKYILAEFITKDCSTVKFFDHISWSNNEELHGDLQVLRKKGLLSKASSMGIYSIKPWVKEFLEDNVDVLEDVIAETDSETDKE